jgi:hypothetical protein
MSIGWSGTHRYRLPRYLISFFSSFNAEPQMLNGLSGTLLSHYFAERLLVVEFGGELGEASAPAAFQNFCRSWRNRASQLGPASSIRSISEQSVFPLAESLGFVVDGGPVLKADGARVALLVGRWTDSLDTLWRQSLRAGLNVAASWCFCCNGHQLRLVDAEHTHARAYIEFDLALVAHDALAFSIFWGVLRAEAFRRLRGQSALIDRIVARSARHGAAVGRSLRVGVIDAVNQLLSGLLQPRLRRRKASVIDLESGFDESLTLVYRVLFLMFAEARGLVPSWHPIYRDHYTIEALRDAADHPRHGAGLWETLQAISRLAHRGCEAGTLRVHAFNGRLFSPARAPMAESCSVANDVIRKALVSLSTAVSEGSVRGVGTRRTRIDYRDLGVEQLGAVYESILEYEPAVADPESSTSKVLLRRGGGQRKATGSFYTPQSITDYLVRRTLHPLADHATPHQILQLRIVDPSMGSAAFLVAACRYLAAAYERALLREGECHEGEIGEDERVGFRRVIAQRCLYGVDLNPTAVQLARLSLWLATLAAGKPLSFLDHRLVCGDSLLGASPVDLARQAPPGARRSASTSGNVKTPLFSDADLETSLALAVAERNWIADVADDGVEVVRQKEQRLERLHATGNGKTVANLWCASWMWPAGEPGPGAAVFAALRDQVLAGRTTLPSQITGPLLRQSQAIAASKRFLHWALEFPEVYFGAEGQPLTNPGFDAVLGNPPWNVVGRDSSERPFVRGSGIYRHQGGGHINRYQLFVERALALLKRGGRVGLVVPSGFATDHTSSALRRKLLDECDIDSLAGFDNRRAIFPIHRSVRFVLFTATTGRATTAMKCRFGIADPELLDRVPDHGDCSDALYPITFTRELITKLSGEHVTIPELQTNRDLSILERMADRFPRLGEKDGWNAKFGRELNATDDKQHFRSASRAMDGLPVLEGKHIEPFVAHPELSTVTIDEHRAVTLIDPARSFGRARLAYRDVASSTNRLSLIAAIVPRGVVTTHSLFCLKSLLGDDEQEYLCGMLNSLVANYLVRQVMTTHLGSTTIENLRLPKVATQSATLQRIASLARSLRVTPTPNDAALLQAAAACAYQLTAEEFRHILSTFPLLPESERAAALGAFNSSETCASA